MSSHRLLRLAGAEVETQIVLKKKATFLTQVVLGVLVGLALVSGQEMDAVADAVSGSLLGPTLPEDSSHPSAMGQTRVSAKGMLNRVLEVHWGHLLLWLARGDLGYQRLREGSFPSGAACNRPAWS